MTVETPWREWVEKTFGFAPDKWERERFLRHCHIDGDCWVWNGPDKYVVDGVGYKPLKMAFAMLRGPAKGNVKSTCGKVCCMPKHMACFTETKETADVV